MAGNATKKRNPTDVPPAEDVSSSGAWRPEVEADREFNPFANTTVAGEERSQISDTPQEPAAVEQPSVAASARRPSRKRQPGGRGGRAGRKAKGSAKRARGSRAKTKAKTKAKAKAKAKTKTKTKTKARVKRKAVARNRSAKTARRRTRRRSATRR